MPRRRPPRLLVAAPAVLRARAFEVWCWCAGAYFFAAQTAGDLLPRGVRRAIVSTLIAVAALWLVRAAYQTLRGDLSAASQARRAKWRGLCQCGYDLTGNVSGRCPECGTSVVFAER